MGKPKGKKGLQTRSTPTEPPAPTVSEKFKSRITILVAVIVTTLTIATGVLGLLITLNQLPSNIVIDEIREPVPAMPSESRIILKNNSPLLSLMDIRTSRIDATYRASKIEIASSDWTDNAHERIPKISPGERVSLHALPMEHDIALRPTECTYILELEFHQKFLFFDGPRETKSWLVELRNPPNALPQWDTKPISQEERAERLKD